MLNERKIRIDTRSRTIMVKKRTCSIKACNREAVRSLALDRVEQTGLKVDGEKRAHLCKQHYKEFKKRTKKDRKIERLKWGI
ncbi:hypothetical protein DRO61_12375 [Candidatus Bathyarchaeota archaeon]|nr:MAG: hypothetical protein DRO61_12375 [Candidatus Bathyarchaeota archaeon]